MVFEKGHKYYPRDNYKMSEETKEKMKKSQKEYYKTHKGSFNGKTHSEESKKKMSVGNKGKTPWQKQLGENHPKVIAYKKKMSKVGKFCKGRVPWNKGLDKTDERVATNILGFKRFWDNISKENKDIINFNNSLMMKEYYKHNSNPATFLVNKINITAGLKRAYKKGKRSSRLESNGNWLGGKSFEPYGIEFNNILKENIKQRDGFVCMCCYKKRVLSVHHIDYDKNNCKENNLISLCKSCHGITNGNRNYWTKYLMEVLEYARTNTSEE